MNNKLIIKINNNHTSLTCVGGDFISLVMGGVTSGNLDISFCSKSNQDDSEVHTVSNSSIGLLEETVTSPNEAEIMLSLSSCISLKRSVGEP